MIGKGNQGLLGGSRLLILVLCLAIVMVCRLIEPSLLQDSIYSVNHNVQDCLWGALGTTANVYPRLGLERHPMPGSPAARAKATVLTLAARWDCVVAVALELWI